MEDPPESSHHLKRTIYVGGLDENVTKEVFEAAFIPFGDIRTVALPKDRLTGKHRGFGFIEFEEEEDAQHSIMNMHEAELYGRVLTVNLARKPAREPGTKYSVWPSDSSSRNEPEELSSTTGETQETDQALEALMKCSEVQEVMEKRSITVTSSQDNDCQNK